VPVILKEANDISEIVRHCLEIAAELPDGHFLWFRGHGSSTYTLCPSLMREGQTADAVFDREARLLTRFRQRSLAYWPSGYPQTAWEHMFAMQHFGMPTRLLDWSENLFVAAHFALNDRASDAAADDHPEIWCVDPTTWNRKVPNLADYGDIIRVLTTTDDEIESYSPETIKKRNKTPVAIYGTHNSDRIVAQKGTFFVWGNDAGTMEDFCEHTGATLWKISITGNRQHVAQQLAALGFAETAVFPELSALATELSRVEGWR
jgi:hypothetical protein